MTEFAGCLVRREWDGLSEVCDAELAAGCSQHRGDGGVMLFASGEEWRRTQESGNGR